jgi:uncharacterized membrane protein (UPF0127 family)
MKAFLVESMNAWRVQPVSAGGEVCLRVRFAQGFWARARGLLGRPPPAPGCGLLLPNVAAVHGFGMRHALDLIFLDARGVVVDCGTLAPMTIACCREARHVLEMRSGEIRRLGLRRHMTLWLIGVDDIFSPDSHAAVAAPRDVEPGVSSARSPAARRREAGESSLGTLAVAVLLAFLQQPLPASGADLVQGLLRPLSEQTLQRLEEEAEALYRREGADADSAALLRRYESLAELSPRRAPHAWLRIGNIHQRAGAVGAAIDAYRNVSLAGRRLQAPAQAVARQAPASAAAEDAAASAAPSIAAIEGKALLNISSLALEQARQSLTILAALATLPTPLEVSAGQGGPSPAGGSGTHRTDPGAQAGAAQSLGRQLETHLETLEQSLAQLRHPSDRATADKDPQAQAPYVVERYTASARRNAVRAARGGVQSDPDRALPVPPVAPPRSRRAASQLPSVEYLLGDPLRSPRPAGATAPPPKQTGTTVRQAPARPDGPAASPGAKR